MELDVYRLLEANPVLVLFLILGLGLLVGEIRIVGVQLGGVTGVLFVGLFVGHFGLAIPTASHDIGFLLFIYCIGVQAGPRFVSVFREDGPKYAWLSLITALLGIFVAHSASEFFEFDLGISGGLLAGGLTSTPTLVATRDAVGQGLLLPSGISEKEVLNNVSAAYAITYVFGLAGLVLAISFIPRLFAIDVAEEAQTLAKQRGMGDDAGPSPLLRPAETPSIRAYRIENPAALGRRFPDRDDSFPGEIQKIKRGEEVFTPDEDSRLQEGDIVAVIGLRAAHEAARTELGPEILDPDVLERSVESRNIVVSKSEVAGTTLAEFEFGAAHQCWLTQLTRSGIPMPRRPDLELQIGDILLVTGPRSVIDELAGRLGQAEHELHETDLVTMAFGIALGVFVGMVSIKLGDASIGLGSAGGVLLAGLLFGLVNSYRPGFGRLPGAARQILMQLGLLLFMAGVAVSAGESILETLDEVGLSLALCGVAVTLVPVVVCFLLGRYVFKMNAAMLLGAITGAMTSTAALQQVSGVARSTVPMLGYVGTYAFANVLLAFAGGVIMRL
jgi:putative transport protein